MAFLDLLLHADEWKPSNGTWECTLQCRISIGAICPLPVDWSNRKFQNLLLHSTSWHFRILKHNVRLGIKIHGESLTATGLFFQIPMPNAILSLLLTCMKTLSGCLGHRWQWTGFKICVENVCLSSIHWNSTTIGKWMSNSLWFWDFRSITKRLHHLLLGRAANKHSSLEMNKLG